MIRQKNEKKVNEFAFQFAKNAHSTGEQDSLDLGSTSDRAIVVGRGVAKAGKSFKVFFRLDRSRLVVDRFTPNFVQ